MWIGRYEAELQERFASQRVARRNEDAALRREVERLLWSEYLGPRTLRSRILAFADRLIGR